MMRLRVMIPTEVVLSERVAAVTVEAKNGSFCMLPRHIDYVASLVPGILSYRNEALEERFAAVDVGVVVKRGSDVYVSTRKAVPGPDLGMLRNLLDEKFRRLDEHEHKSRTLIAKMESDFVRKFLNLDRSG